MSKINNLTGKKFGRLKVLEYYGNSKNCKALWLCQCECGNTKIILGNSLTSKATVSCGCYNKEKARERRTKHNLSYSRLYKIWCGMKTRCYNKNFVYYCNYGGRGITICDEWLNDFETFYKWAISNGYEEGLTIDRINNDGNYEPINCRWISRKEQNNNMRKNIIIKYNGKEQTISQWAKEFGINRTALYYRIKRCWNIEKALTEPPKK